MTLMDSKLRDDLRRRYPPNRVVDAFGNEAGHRPGYVFLTSVNDAASELLIELGKNVAKYYRTLGAIRAAL